MMKMRSRESIEGLKDMLRYIGASSKITVMAEIGCYAGESTRVFSVWCKKVYAIDPWVDIYIKGQLRYPSKMEIVEKKFDSVLNDAKNITKIKATSLSGSAFVMDKELDFVYIDGLHTYHAVCEDIREWAAKVKPDGWICGHDFTDKHKECRQAVLDTLGKPEKTFRDGSWVHRKA